MTWWLPLTSAAVLLFALWESRNIRKGEVAFNLHVIRQDERPALFRFVVVVNCLCIVAMIILLVLWAFDFRELRSQW